VVLGTAIGLIRQPGIGALDTVWAEDGRDFLSTATNHSILDAIGTSYAGYFHLVPRLLAATATLAPPRAAGAVLAVAAAACVALVAVLVWVASAAHLRSPLSRAILASVVVLLPLGQTDVLNSIANLQWYGLFALFWVLIWSPASRTGQVVAAVVVVLVAGSDILVLAFVPLALWRALRRPRSPYATVLAALLGLGLAWQVGGLVVGSSSREMQPDPVLAVTGYLIRAVPAGLIGERWLGESVDTGWVLLAGVAWLLVAAAVLAAWLRITRPSWPLALTAAVHSAALYALPVLLSGVATPRYAVAPALLALTALAALLQPRETGAAALAPLGALAGLLAVVCAVNLRIDNERAHGPRWSDELNRARAGCATTGGGTAELTVSPGGQDWRTRLPCRYVLR
jgi:hypothetical protein